ncbi:MAG: GDSL-type esterase/lipase family protein [Nannocystaceae bacterium]|nr:GDSL-type esterase/lipase family protein [bacterium]
MRTPDPSSVDHLQGLLDTQEPPVERVELEGEDDGVAPPAGTFRKIGSGMATLVAMIVVSYIVPAADWARPWTSDDPVLFWNLIGREFLGGEDEVRAREDQLAAMDAIAEVATEQVDDDDADPLPDRVAVDVPAAGGLPPYVPHPDDDEEVPQALELPDPSALDSFYAQLAQTDAGFEGAVTRVSHWGDSVIASDYVTSALRQRMQRRFGDAGHGWHLISTPTLSYRHRGIHFKKGDWENCYIINGCRKDGHYGYGGTVFLSKGSSKATFGTTRKGALGRKVSRFELWYAAEPRGGPIKVSIDGAEPTTLRGKSDTLVDEVEVFEVPDGPHELTVRVNAGRGRLYGVVLERDVPGVVWDGLSNLGAFTGRMLKADPDHIRAQIDRRDPDLLVFQFGGNDLIMKESKYGLLERQTRELIGLYRGTENPRACLVISPVDHGVRKGGRTTSVEAMRPVTELQRKVALEEGCAFFDAQAAMGGPGAIALWRERNLMSADLKHLSEEGQQVFGHLVYLALMQGYRAYRERG